MNDFIQGWHIGIGRYEISVSVIIPADTYRPICNTSDYAWILIKARISADTIGRYIGYDKPILAYRLSVKFLRYANPDFIIVPVSFHYKGSFVQKNHIFFHGMLNFLNDPLVNLC